MNNMNIKLEKVRLEDRNKLERLLQLYLHDLSLYFPITFNSDICQYEYDLDKYFIDNYAYFIKSDKDILGFVLIDDNGNNNLICIKVIGLLKLYLILKWQSLFGRW